MEPDSTRKLARIAQLGGYFTLHPATPSPHGSTGWAELPTLFNPAVLADLVGRTRAAIASASGAQITDIPVRVAASSLQLAVVSRLLSPVVGAVTTLASVPLLTPESVRWKRVGHAVQFGVTGLQWQKVERPADAAGAIVATLLQNVFAPLNDELHHMASLSHKVLWGNVASATNGAVTVLAMTRSEIAPAGRELVAALTATPTLSGAAEFVGGRFVRRNCCLFYLVPNSGLCGDCVLNVSDASH